MINHDRSDIWKQSNWMDEFASDSRLANDLNSIYAEDVLQELKDEDFDSLESAIASLAERVNLTTADVSEVKRIIVAKTEPDVFVAMENIKRLSKESLGKLLKASVTKESTLSSVVTRAVDKIGLQTIAEMYDAFGNNEVKAEEPPAEEASVVSEESAVSPVVDLDALEVDQEAVTAKAENGLVVEARGIKEIMDAENCSAPEAMKKMHAEKKSDSSDDSSDDETHDKKDLDVKEEDKEAEASVKTANKHCDKCDKDECECPEDKKAEASLDGDGCGCGKTSCDCKSTSKDDVSYASQIVEAAKKMKKKKVCKDDLKIEKKKKDKKDKKDKKSKVKFDKKKMKTKKKADAWEAFLTKEGYFQGADQEAMDPNTSNDPTKLGYPGDVSYSNSPMQVPVGGDSRNYEQKKFEGEADVTEKEMLPGGTDLAIKKQWQRAKYKVYLKRFAEASKFAEFDKQSNPAEFLKKKKMIDQQLEAEKAGTEEHPALDGSEANGASKAAPAVAPMAAM